MQYEKKIEEIFERHPSVQVSGFNGRTYKAGIESMLAFDAALGHPWKSFPCIHVAGTNGKGSVSSMLAAALARLKPRERELFKMRQIEGLTNDEIVAQTGITKASVKVMVSAARKKVFDELKHRLKQ